MEAPQPKKKMKVYQVALPDGQVVLFMPCPRNGGRGHHPDNQYAGWRSPKRQLRRQLVKAGVILRSGRAWVKYRKDAHRAYRQYQNDQTMGGILEANPTD